MNPTSAKIDWRAVVLAGIAAGIATSAVQITLWWLFWDVLPEILYRDARLTATIGGGLRVLPPPASFDATVIAVSAVIHFALSILYTALLAVLVARRPLTAAQMLGQVVGAALLAINKYNLNAQITRLAVARE